MHFNPPVKEIWLVPLETFMGINPRAPLLANFLKFEKNYSYKEMLIGGRCKWILIHRCCMRPKRIFDGDISRGLSRDYNILMYRTLNE